MSQNQSMESSKDIERKALDSSGCLGFFYDQRRDRILKELKVSVKGRTLMPSKLSYCEVINGSADTCFNLLQFIGIEDELRLNLLLKVTNRIGIASVMNCSHRINERIRILYYSYINQQEQVTDIAEVSKLLEPSDPQGCATHIITGINLGIDLVVILKLTFEVDITAKIDYILQKTRSILLKDDGNISILIPEENNLLEKNTSITAYSNTSTFNNLTRISDILHYVNRFKTNFNPYRPVTYYLRPITQLHPQYKATLTTISLTFIKELEQCLLQLRIPIQYLEASFKDRMPNSLYGHLEDRLYNARQQFSRLKDQYANAMDRVSHIIAGFRNGQFDASTVHSALNDIKLSTLKTNIDQLAQDVCDSEKQEQLTKQSRQQRSNYCNSVEGYLYENSTTKTTEIIPGSDDRHDESFYINHALSNNNNSERKDFGRLLVDENRNNSNLSPVPVNLSRPSFQLQNIMPPLDNIEYDENQSKPGTPPPADIPQTPILPEPSSPTTNQIINILLLGETGVGKSTFINAFVNYLSFDTFEQAESNKPVVLIPVSFLMTVGDNFEDRIVKFDDVDTSKNEDFDHPGQSVTQHCKSYIFHLNDGKKLCIIDTPGFGDTRGLDQDDRNMQNILEYINNLSHLNAICFLLKPNTSRFNIFFRSCLTQLFDLLGPNICKNLTFCFTNARATFYNPGDTAPLLKNMLDSLPIRDIPFKKENTFCFDSESFRYLVALRNGIIFNEEDKQEYGTSWSTSVKESNRLIDYIRAKLLIHPIQGEWQSIKHAQFEIVHMVRPILEAMRNILRNMILENIESPNKSIELCPTVIHRSASLCLLCKQKKIQIGNFWIIEDCPHELKNMCLSCSCSSDHHILIDYILGYKSMNSSLSYHQNNVNDTLNQLCHASAMFAYFLIYIARSKDEDRFGIGLKRMIFQENDLCDHQKPNDLNSQLAKKLRKLQREYEQKINRIKSNREPIPLPVIYDLMNNICKFPMVQTQMVAVRQGQEILMKQYENEFREI